MPAVEVHSFEPLLEGVLVKRWKRFLCEVELADGEVVTAHCANTGPMAGVLLPGGGCAFATIPRQHANLLTPGNRRKCLQPVAEIVG